MKVVMGLFALVVCVCSRGFAVMTLRVPALRAPAGDLRIRVDLCRLGSLSVPCCGGASPMLVNAAFGFGVPAVSFCVNAVFGFCVPAGGFDWGLLSCLLRVAPNSGARAFMPPPKAKVRYLTFAFVYPASVVVSDELSPVWSKIGGPCVHAASERGKFCDNARVYMPPQTKGQ